MVYPCHPLIASAQFDRALVARFCEQADQAALHQLLRRHRGLVMTILQRFPLDLDPEDLLQEIYLILHQKLPRTSEVRNFPGWLSIITQNYLRDRLRRQGSFLKYQSSQQDRSDSYEEHPETALDRRTLVEAAFAQVNEAEAICLRLRFFHDMSYREIADELDLTFKQVCGRLNRGINKMRNHMVSVNSDQ